MFPGEGWQKPVRVVYLGGLTGEEAAGKILDFLSRENPAVLNVAGPRESKCPGIYEAAKNILLKVFNLNSRYQ